MTRTLRLSAFSAICLFLLTVLLPGQAIGPMQAARIGATATTLNDGTILIAGGETGSVALATLERFDPATLSFNPVFATLSTPRQNHAAALLPGGRVLMAGGFDGSATLDTLVPGEADCGGRQRHFIGSKLYTT
jgi:hypothetical protein